MLRVAAKLDLPTPREIPINVIKFQKYILVFLVPEKTLYYTVNIFVTNSS